jgi:hypothetical protein
VRQWGSKIVGQCGSRAMRQWGNKVFGRDSAGLCCNVTAGAFRQCTGTVKIWMVGIDTAGQFLQIDNMQHGRYRVGQIVGLG